MASVADLNKIAANATLLTPLSGVPSAKFASVFCTIHAGYTAACASCKIAAGNTIDHMRRAGYTW